MSESETDPLLGDQLPSGTRIYASRWYIVGIFSIFGTIQSWQWSLYAPLNLAVKGSYDWSESSFAMMTNWGNISFIFSIIPMSWILEKKGLRPAVLLCCTLSLLSLSVRCASTSNPTTFMAFAHIGSIMNGVSGTMVLSAPAVLSSTWFPPSERTIATSISQMFAVFGNALSLLVGPRVVSDAGVNATDPSMTPENVKTRIRGDMFHYLLIFTIINILLSLAIWIHFPSKPKMPPSSSSTALRDDFMSGILKLIKNKTAWLLVFAYSAMIGIQSGWSGIQSLDYEYLGINDKEDDDSMRTLNNLNSTHHQSPSSHGANLQWLSTIISCICSLALAISFGINFSYFRGSYRNNLFISELLVLLVSFSAGSQDLVLILGGVRNTCSHGMISWVFSGCLHVIAGLSLVSQLSQTCYFTSFCTLKIIGGVLQILLALCYGLKAAFAFKERREGTTLS